jgi:hypothetical protein
VNDPDRRRSPDGFDDDAIFADIVAHLNDDVTQVDRAAPATDNLETDLDPTDPDPTDQPTAQSTNLPGDRPRADSGRGPINPPPWSTENDPQAVAAPQPWRAHEVHDEDEEHFEPPPVTPLPAGDLSFWAILAGMGGGPLLLLYLAFFNRNADGYWILIAIAMSVGGFALLVSRMPGHQDDDDDGARL